MRQPVEINWSCKPFNIHVKSRHLDQIYVFILVVTRKTILSFNTNRQEDPREFRPQRQDRRAPHPERCVSSLSSVLFCSLFRRRAECLSIAVFVPPLSACARLSHTETRSSPRPDRGVRQRGVLRQARPRVRQLQRESRGEE